MTKKWEGPTTDSLEKRGRKVDESGVVEGMAWIGIVAGACGVGAALIGLVVYLI